MNNFYFGRYLSKWTPTDKLGYSVYNIVWFIILYRYNYDMRHLNIEIDSCS